MMNKEKNVTCKLSDHCCIAMNDTTHSAVPSPVTKNTLCINAVSKVCEIVTLITDHTPTHEQSINII